MSALLDTATADLNRGGGTYLCGHGGRCGPDAYGWGSIPDDHCWHESTRRRLAWQYGEARAAAIMAGTDSASQRDIAAWNRLGASA